MEQLLADGGHKALGGAGDRIIPRRPVPLHLPIAAVDGELGRKKSKLFFQAAQVLPIGVQLKLGKERHHLLLDRADMLPGSVQDMQAVAPAEFSLHGKNSAARLIVDIVAVKPGKEALLEQ